MSIARTPDEVKLIQVIEVKCARGAGTEEDVVRIVTQYWSIKGELLAEYDSEVNEQIIKHNKHLF